MDGKPADIDEYLFGVPEEARATLASLQRTIREAAPEAEESISYGSPTFKYRGRPLIYFAAAKNHCAIYGIDVEAHRKNWRRTTPLKARSASSHPISCPMPS